MLIEFPIKDTSLMLSIQISVGISSEMRAEELMRCITSRKLLYVEDFVVRQIVLGLMLQISAKIF